ncbi:hypothetical protein [Blastopirellula marina]|uniref:EF-hand domain-containing protein n=1 Tax=Blastopirellula marina TaxID=124 RepID=A0A2S8GC37_9BACT|nr:hypothetical protein [Blastopirellula marina]PQO41989.1 hypothetical protein C5Y93_26895 [Blastopirellula marina]
MKTIVCLTSLLALGLVSTTAWAQRPQRPPADGNQVEAMLAKLKPFDANGDGAITIEEATDDRLKPLFERADEDGDGVATFDEITALLERESTGQSNGSRRGRPPAAPPMGPPPGGPRPMGPPEIRIGQVLPPFLADRLELTGDQKEKLEELQEMVDQRLKTILTQDQISQLQQLRPPGRGPAGPPPRN